MHRVLWQSRGENVNISWEKQDRFEGDLIFELSLDGREPCKSNQKVEKIFVSKETTSERDEWKWLTYGIAGSSGGMQYGKIRVG